MHFLGLFPAGSSGAEEVFDNSLPDAPDSGVCVASSPSLGLFAEISSRFKVFSEEWPSADDSPSAGAVTDDDVWALVGLLPLFRLMELYSFLTLFSVRPGINSAMSLCSGEVG